MTDRRSERPTREEDGYPGEKARQGYIVLNSPVRRWVFFGGIIGFVLLVFVVMLLT